MIIMTQASKLEILGSKNSYLCIIFLHPQVPPTSSEAKSHPFSFLISSSALLDLLYYKGLWDIIVVLLRKEVFLALELNLPKSWDDRATVPHPNLRYSFLYMNHFNYCLSLVSCSLILNLYCYKDYLTK